MDKRSTKHRRKPAAKLGKSDRWPSDYGVRDAQDRDWVAGEAARGGLNEKDKRSWVPGEKGQGREGRSRGYGGSEGRGTGPSGPEVAEKGTRVSGRRRKRP